MVCSGDLGGCSWHAPNHQTSLGRVKPNLFVPVFASTCKGDDQWVCKVDAGFS